MRQRRAVPVGIATATAVMLAAADASHTGQAPAGQVDNVRIERVEGGVITISYDLKSDDPSAVYTVVLDASLDGGRTFGSRPRTVSGDVGSGVAPGLIKRIVWEAGQDVETVQVDQWRFRVTAEPDAVQRSTAGTRTSAPASSTAAPGQTHGGSRAKWLIPLVGAGGAGAAIAARSRTTATPTPPLASMTIPLNGAALVGVTVVTFEASRDASPQATYSWNFGDGATATGLTTTHVYDREGTFSIALTVSNGSASATARGSVTARSLTGVWTPAVHFAGCFSVRLTHTSSRVDAIAINGSQASVTLQAPRDITLAVAAAPAQGCGLIQVRGQLDPLLDAFTVPFAASPTGTDTWRRQ
jgi:PKD domain-containing protein